MHARVHCPDVCQATVAAQWAPCLALNTDVLRPSHPPPLQELAARIIQAGERPDIDPKAVVLWVGTNNVKNPNKGNADPADKLDWCARALPALCCCIRECRDLAAVKRGKQA